MTNQNTKASPAVRLRDDRNMTSLQRRDEKERMVLLWIFIWGATTARILQRLLELKDTRRFSTFLSIMKKRDGLIKDIGHEQRRGGTLLCLTQKGMNKINTLISAGDIEHDFYARKIDYSVLDDEHLGLAGPHRRYRDRSGYLYPQQ